MASSLDSLLDDADPAEIFDILEKLGEGSYGEVYAAIDRRTGRSVALKVIPCEGSEGELLTLRREIDILRKCNSPYVVEYLGSYRRDGDLWICMSLCSAGSLADIMAVAEITLLEEELQEVAAAVLLGLQYLHDEVKCIHRDLKAGNILATEEGALKLADFGVSAQLSATISRRKTTIGTPFWLSPEIIQGEAQGSSGYDCRADIWALGITMIELADGAPPYADKVHPLRALFLIPTREPPTVADPSAWSPTFNDFVKTCLKKKFEERPFARELLKHPFVASSAARIQAAGGKSALIAELVQKVMPLIEEARREDMDNVEGGGDEEKSEEKEGSSSSRERPRPESKESVDGDEGEDDAGPSGTMVVSGTMVITESDAPAASASVSGLPGDRSATLKPAAPLKKAGHSATMVAGKGAGGSATITPGTMAVLSRTMKPGAGTMVMRSGATLRGPLKPSFVRTDEDHSDSDFKSAHGPRASAGLEDTTAPSADDSTTGSFGSTGGGIPAFRSNLASSSLSAAVAASSSTTGVGAIGSIYTADVASLRRLGRDALEARLTSLDAAFRVDMAELTSRYDRARKAIEDAMRAES